MRLNDEQLAEIRARLDQGMTPEDIGNFFGRVADLDAGDVATIRAAAADMAAAQAPHDES